MFILGMLAIFQILFFPGLIFFVLFKPKGGVFFKLSVIVAISMLFNATLIYPLVLLHLYTQTIIWIVIILEILALAWLNRHIIKTDFNALGQNLNNGVSETWRRVESIFQSEKYSGAVKFLRGCVIVLVGGLAVSLIIWFMRRLTNNFGSVFNSWDAVVSWNAWAQSWAQNQLPNIHLTYPQLLPLNLSLTYLLTGNFDVSLFAKAIMPIFALLTVLMVIELSVDQKQYGYLIAVIIIYLLYKKFLGEYITEGYADIPVAFMALTALVPYLRSENFWSDQKEIILSFLLAAAAALTKQVGLYILVLLPVIGLINGRVKLQKSVWRQLLWVVVPILLILPWYLPIGIQVLQDFSKLGLSQYVSHSTQVQDSASPLLRTAEAFIHLGKYVVLYAFLIPAFFLVKRRFKLLILLFLIPLSLLWGAIASYDERNLSLTFACVAIIAGLGLESLLEYGFLLLERIKLGRLSAAFLLLLVIFPVGYFAWKLNDDKLIQTWKTAQSQIFSPEINAQVFGLDRSDPTCTKILTNYPVDFLPGLKGMQVNSYFSDYGVYETLIAEPDVCWIMVPNYIDSSIKTEIDRNLEDGAYQLLFSTDQWVPYRLIKIR